MRAHLWETLGGNVNGTEQFQLLWCEFAHHSSVDAAALKITNGVVAALKMPSHVRADHSPLMIAYVMGYVAKSDAKPQTRMYRL